MRKTLIILIAIIFSTAFLKSPVFSKGENIHPFDTLYQQNNIIFSELKISGWAKIKNNDSSKTQMENLMEIIKKEFNMVGQEQWREDDVSKTLIVSNKINEDTVTVTISSISPMNAEKETYLTINIDSQNYENYNYNLEKLGRIFEYNNAEPNISKTMIGYLQGELSLPEQERIVRLIFKEINGIIIEGVSEENFISFSGYTPYFTNSVESLGKKINVNIATRYHNIDDKTYIYMGTPVIHCQY